MQCSFFNPEGHLKEVIKPNYTEKHKMHANIERLDLWADAVSLFFLLMEQDKISLAELRSQGEANFKFKQCSYSAIVIADCCKCDQSCTLILNL